MNDFEMARLIQGAAPAMAAMMMVGMTASMPRPVTAEVTTHPTEGRLELKLIPQLPWAVEDLPRLIDRLVCDLSWSCHWLGISGVILK